jgi:hypothetical protein
VLEQSIVRVPPPTPEVIVLFFVVVFFMFFPQRIESMTIVHTPTAVYVF